MENEIWISVKGYEGSYEVSNMANVRTVERIISRKTKLGHLKSFPIKGKIKTKRIGNNGYYSVALVLNNITKNTLLHRIVAFAFVANPNNYKVVCHEDNNKLNCLPYNLKWGTASYNNKMAIADGIRKPKYRVLNQSNANVIRKFHNEGLTYKQICMSTGYSISTIGGYLTKRSYKHLK